MTEAIPSSGTTRRKFLKDAAVAAVVGAGASTLPSAARAAKPAGSKRYGMVIDARRCIGCHGCSVACKAEFDVPLGVTRSWVEYVEKGAFPNVNRSFLPRLCNHCNHPPCVDICPTNATYLERWDYEDMVSPTQVAEYGLRQPVIKPLGEVRDFGDVCCDLAERMGFPLGIKDKEDFVKMSCEKTPGVKEAGGFEYMKKNGVWHDPKAKPRYFSYKKAVKAEAYEKDGVVLDAETGVYWNWKKAHVESEEVARQKGYTHTKKSYKAYVGQKIGDKVVSGFKPDKVNKTGFLEIYSALMEDKGLSPLPVWIDIPGHKDMKPNDLILTTYKVANQIHSRSQNCKWLTEIYNDNPAQINPETAAKAGIADGDPIVVSSAIGSLETKARVTPTVVPGVVAISHHMGHWEYGRYASGKAGPTATDDDPDLERKWWTAKGAHPNWIIPNAPDPINGQQCWMDPVVTVKRAAVA